MKQQHNDQTKQIDIWSAIRMKNENKIIEYIENGYNVNRIRWVCNTNYMTTYTFTYGFMISLVLHYYIVLYQKVIWTL